MCGRLLGSAVELLSRVHCNRNLAFAQSCLYPTKHCSDLSSNSLADIPADTFTALGASTNVMYVCDNLLNAQQFFPSCAPVLISSHFSFSLRGSSNLNNNELTAVPALLFQGLTEITDINLNHNQLTTLPSGLFTGLTKLLSMYVGSSQ